MTALLEVCVDSIESAVAAAQGGADRLELCGALATGGITPSDGLVRRTLFEVELPVMMMIRPHAGGFVYKEPDIEVMLADMDVARSLGVEGVVLGVLTEDRNVDAAACRRLLAAAEGLSTTFHRAFDLVADPWESLDALIDLGFDRVLTSGQAATAEAGVELLRQLQTGCQDRITIVAGAGVDARNASMLVRAAGISEIHASASVAAEGQSNASVAFGDKQRVASAEIVRAIKQALAEST